MVSSGVIPYRYSTGNYPFRNDTHPEVTPGPSGLILEESAFVLLAEIRRHIGTDANILLPRYYTHQEDRFGVGYEPKADGSNLRNAPLEMVVPTITELRKLLTGITGNATYPSPTIGEWLRAMYPDHPRGDDDGATNEMTRFARPAPSGGGISQGVLSIPSGLIGIERSPVNDAFIIDGADSKGGYYMLGSSGVLIDLDFGELMYNPLPRINTQVVSAHSILATGGMTLTAETMASTPGFVDTTGDTYDDAGSTPRPANAVSITGDVLFSNTEYLISSNGTENFDAGTSTFTYNSANGTEWFVGGPVDDLNGAWVDAPNLSRGVYAVTVANRKANFPYAPVESGINHFAPNFQVFNNAPLVNTGFGVALLSPITSGQVAGFTRTTGDGVFEFACGVGLARVSRSNIKKTKGVSSTFIPFGPEDTNMDGSYDPGEFRDFVIGFGTWNDEMEFQNSGLISFQATRGLGTGGPVSRPTDSLYTGSFVRILNNSSAFTDISAGGAFLNYIARRSPFNSTDGCGVTFTSGTWNPCQGSSSRGFYYQGTLYGHSAVILASMTTNRISPLEPADPDPDFGHERYQMGEPHSLDVNNAFFGETAASEQGLISAFETTSDGLWCLYGQRRFSTYFYYFGRLSLSGTTFTVVERKFIVASSSQVDFFTTSRNIETAHHKGFMSERPVST